MNESPRDDLRPRRRRMALTLGVLAAVGLATAATAMARPLAPQHLRHDADPIDPAKARVRAERLADRIVDKLDGSEGQRQQVRAILVGRVADVLSLRAEGEALRARIFEALMREPRPDAAEIEALRVEALALADRASKVLVATFFDLADVLSDAQLEQVRDRLSWLYD